MTFDETLERIQLLGFGSDSDSVAMQTRAIELATLEIAGERGWSWLQTQATGTLTVGSENITEPTDMAVPTTMRLSRGVGTSDPHYVNLNRIQLAEAREWLYQDQGTDLPSEWAYIDRQVVVYPRPDFAYNYQLDYIKFPAANAFDASGESNPLIDERFQTLWVFAAARYLAERQREPSMSALWEARYQAQLRRARAADPNNRQQTHVKRWGGWAVLDP